MNGAAMNVDEALLLADDYTGTGHVIAANGSRRALQLLAAEVRRQHAELTRLQQLFDLAAPELRCGIQLQLREIDRLRAALADVAAEMPQAVLHERNRCAWIARHGCLVPPDGGSPTEAERLLCEEIARRIRAEAA